MPEPLNPAEYGRQVRQALADLPPTLVEEVLEDLDEHLTEAAAETVAEGGGPLEERLGPPAGYASELRRAAGLPQPAAPDRAARTGRADTVRDAVTRLGEHDAVRSALAFLPELRPAWWVLRAWLAVAALGSLSGYSSPFLSFRGILGLPLVAAAVVLSVRLGRRAQRRPYREPRQRLLALAGNGLLALLAVVTLIGVQQRAQPVYASGDTSVPGYNPGGTLTRQDGSPITNIYPYTAAGQPLTGVLLYDQDGRALDNLSPTTGDGQPLVRVVPSGSPPPPANAYPQHQRTATDGDPGLATPEPPVPPNTAPTASLTTTTSPSAAPSTATTPTASTTPGRPAGP